MKNTCEKYSEEAISRYVDNELCSEETSEIANHIETCELCRTTVEKYDGLSSVFAENTARAVEKINKEPLSDMVWQSVTRNENHFFKKVFDYFSPKLYLKIASIAVIMVISLVYFQTKPVNTVGPSAIVKSVDGNISSVMIFETKNKQHTIIWFSET